MVVSNKEFFDVVFSGVSEGAHAWGTSFETPPDKASNKEWFGRTLNSRVVEKNRKFNGNVPANTFYVVSSFRPNGDGKTYRRQHNFAAMHVITLDDIGDGDSAKVPWDRVALEPTFVIETSPDNCQVGYVFKTPVTDMDYAERVVDALVHQGLAAEKDPGMKGVTRYVRFPVGINNKTKYGDGWAHHVREWNPDNLYDIEDIVEAYGLVPAAPSKRATSDLIDIAVEDDPYIPALREAGLALRDYVREDTKLDILCPFHEDHTDRVDQGTVYMVGGGFKCMHGHCIDRPSSDFIDKLRRDYDIDVTKIMEQVKNDAKDAAVMEMFDEEPGGAAKKEKAENKLSTKLLAKIKEADEDMLEIKLPRLIRMANLTTIERERVVKAYQDRYRDVLDVKLPLQSIRADLTPTNVVGEAAPEWCDDWVYVESHAAYGQKSTGRLTKAEGFNLANGRYVPMSERGFKQAASKYVADWGFVQSVHALAYLPMFPDRVCRLDGHDVLNTFKPSTVPYTADEIDKKGQKVIKRTQKHIRFITGNDEDAEILTQWLAHQVQRPGTKLLWSPVIQSIQGIGKSFFGELMGLVLGDANVGVVSPQQAVSPFNGWATNVCLNVLEELRIQGHNRYEALNAVKPLITDKKIQINEKNVKPFTTLNTANYICFTNYKDALPLDGTDRRWWVVFADIQSLDDLEAYVGETKEQYFEKLFSGIRRHPDQLRKWLLEYPISDAFLNIKQAPMTRHKEMMIATEEASIEGLSEVKELLKTGGEYYNSDVVSTSDLFDAMMFEHPEVTLNNIQKSNLMKRLGFQKVTSPIKIDGEVKRVWVRRSMTNEEIRTVLK